MSYSPTQIAAYILQKKRRLFNSGNLNIGFPILLTENNDYIQNEDGEYMVVDEE